MSSRKTQEVQLLETSNQIKALCGELFSNTPITLFCYTRYSRDRVYMGGMSDAEIYNFYVQNKYHFSEFQHCDYDKDIPQGSFFSELVCSSEEEKAVNTVFADKFKIGNFIGIVNKQADYCDIYNFATPINVGNMHNFYLNNIHLLEKYVQVLAAPLTNIVKENSVPKLYIPEVNIITPDTNFNDKRIENFSEIITKTLDSGLKLNSTQAVSDETIFKSLTSRELDCLRLVARGYTSKEIARALSLSFRTVENYCERLKIKLNCRRKQDIIANYSGIFEGQAGI